MGCSPHCCFCFSAGSPGHRSISPKPQHPPLPPPCLPPTPLGPAPASGPGWMGTEPAPSSVTLIPRRLRSLFRDMTEGGTCVFLASAALQEELETRGVDRQQLGCNSPCCAHRRWGLQLPARVAQQKPVKMQCMEKAAFFHAFWGAPQPAVGLELSWGGRAGQCCPPGALGSLPWHCVTSAACTGQG